MLFRSNKCMPDIMGSRACLSKVNITVSKAFWCGKEYIEVKDGFGKVKEGKVKKKLGGLEA